MRRIENYSTEKYESGQYFPEEEGIYRLEENGGTLYVTSLPFVQEPELKEGGHAGELSQYPLEDILDEFYCPISDFYEDLNTPQAEICCLEFAAPDLEDIRKLRTVIGRHVYNKEANGFIELIIE